MNITLTHDDLDKHENKMIQIGKELWRNFFLTVLKQKALKQGDLISLGELIKEIQESSIKQGE